MKYCFLIIVSLVVVLFVQADAKDIFREAITRKRCVGQIFLSDGILVRTWKQGTHMWCETNLVPSLVGVRQMAPQEEWMHTLVLSNETLGLKVIDLQEGLDHIWADFHAATNQASLAKDFLIQKRDQAILPATKTIYQTILDHLYPKEIK